MPRLILPFCLFLTLGGVMPCAAAPAADAGAPTGQVLIGVADFTGVDTAIQEAITETFTNDLVSSKRVVVVERSLLKKVLEELRLQQGGLVDTEQAAAVGKQLGASKMVVGSFTRAGARIALSARLVDVATGRIETGGATQIEGNIEGQASDIYELAHQLATRFHYSITGEWLPAVAIRERPGMALGPIRDLLALATPPDSQASIRLDVKLDKGAGATYFVGETMTISLRVDRPCYVYLFNVDTSRQVTMLYPNRFHPEETVKPDQWIRVPGDREGWELGIEGEVGEEEIVAIASTRSLMLGNDPGAVPGIGKGFINFVSKAVVPRLSENPEERAAARIIFHTSTDRIIPHISK